MAKLSDREVALHCEWIDPNGQLNRWLAKLQLAATKLRKIRQRMNRNCKQQREEKEKRQAEKEAKRQRN